MKQQVNILPRFGLQRKFLLKWRKKTSEMRVEKWLKIGKIGCLREKDLALEKIYIKKMGRTFWGGGRKQLAATNLFQKFLIKINCFFLK